MSFPKFNRQRHSISSLRLRDTVTITGRIVAVDTIKDASGSINFSTPDFSTQTGDIVALTGHLTPTGFSAQHLTLLVRPEQWPTAPSISARALTARHKLLSQSRRFFEDLGFLEVETPMLVHSPGTDPYLETFTTMFSGMGDAKPAPLFLHTSPEFAMKALLVDGFEQIFQICKVFRNGEWTPLHNPEFTMIEWYRAFTDQSAMMHDVEALVCHLLGDAVLWKDLTIPLSRPFERLPVRDAFLTHCRGLDLFEANCASSLRAEAERLGLGPLAPGDRWDDLFHELLVTWVEPNLGFERPTFLTEYPAPLAVLSRRSDSDPRVAERFELYIAGLELCNGFTELNDPNEQRLRFEEDLHRRAQLNLPAYPMPEHFLDALKAGMPPSSGVAVGFDRLLMLATNQHDLGLTMVRTISSTLDPSR